MNNRSIFKIIKKLFNTDCEFENAILNCMVFREKIKLKNKNSTHGYVYFLQDNSGFKIGMTTKTLKSRLASLKTGNQNLKLFGYISTNNAFSLEKSIHEKFKKFRSNGEWFNVNSTKIKNIIKNYKGLVL